MKEILATYLKPELSVLAIVLYIIGIYLKKSKLKDNLIPLVLGLTGIVLAIAYVCILEGFGMKSILTGIIQGILYAAASVYINQMIKQSNKEE